VRTVVSRAPGRGSATSAGSLTGRKARQNWDRGFGARLAARDFDEYDQSFGEDHRQYVEHDLRRAAP
jgi:hypothetical protein